MENNEKIVYKLDQEPIVLSKGLLDLLLKQENPSDCIALYTFLYYTAKQQKNKEVKTTTENLAKSLNWSDKRVRKTKKILQACNLIEDTIKQGEDGKIIGYFIKIKEVHYV